MRAVVGAVSLQRRHGALCAFTDSGKKIEAGAMFLILSATFCLQARLDQDINEEAFGRLDLKPCLLVAGVERSDSPGRSAPCA